MDIIDNTNEDEISGKVVYVDKDIKGHFDIIDETILWSECKTEEECKKIIHNDLIIIIVLK